jgi:uncharacterized membrane protein YgdD (TMEM256/DUF423 family)
VKTSNAFIAIGALGCMFGVAAGAFGAHALEAVLTPERMVTWGKGVDYLFVHALGLILVGLLETARARKCHRVAGSLMLVGIVLFSGSLFTLVLSGATWLGMITPLGGVAFIAAWLLLGICYLLSD